MTPTGPESGWGRCGERIRLAYEAAEAIDLPALERAVLAYLAWRANDDTRLAWPSQETIARHLRHNSGTIREALAELIRADLVELARRAAGPGRGHSEESGRANAYRLTFLPEEKTGGSDAVFSLKDRGSDVKDRGSDVKDRGSDVKDRGSDVKHRGSRVSDQPERDREYHIESHIEHRSTPPTPPNAQAPALVSVEVVERGEGLLSESRYLDTLIAEVRAGREERGLSLSRRQAVAARAILRDRLTAGLDTRVIVLGLVATSAFTDPAFDFAVGQLRQERGRNEPRGFAGTREYLRRRGQE